MQIMLFFSRIFRSDSAKFKSIDKKTKRRLFSVLLIILVGSIGLLVVMHHYVTGQTPPMTNQTSPTTNQTWSGTPFFASIDTMKESRDTETRPLSSNAIVAIVKLSASVNTNYITVDTHWEYSNYLQQWVDAIRAAGRHVWFRSQPNQWENQNGATGTMTPAQYEAAEQNLILTHASLFQSGDIFDACPEPEQGYYWLNQYGDRWTWNAPNSATREYNAFIRDTTDVANAAFQQRGIQGVITTIRSTNTFFASHPDVFEQATAEKLGRMTIDSYPEQSTTDPLTAANARVEELKTIENIWHLPMIIGEMGYSNQVEVDDGTQQSVLKAEFQAIEPLSYVAGVNYWVGPGTNASGGYTHIFAQSGQRWFLRPAANELSFFYKTKVPKSGR